MQKNLRVRFLSATLITILLLLGAVWLLTRGFIIPAVVVLVFVCVIVIGLNIWFSKWVSDPLENLIQHIGKVAGGSYGVSLPVNGKDEISRLTEAVNGMSEQVAIGEKYRTEFISQVSHELRTPLTAITGWAETIAYDPAVQGDSLRGIQIISKEAERLTGMVTELLEFTRIQDGRFNLRIELIDIAAELEDAIFTYGELMRQAGIDLNYDAPEDEIPLISADPERLKQVFTNVFDNARKHGGDGEKIDVTLSQDKINVIITVRDYGHGIPEAELPHVKEKFYKGSSKNRGTGIGLAVCDEIITRHGGSLLVENAEGGGCRVTIKLPKQNGEYNASK